MLSTKNIIVQHIQTNFKCFILLILVNVKKKLNIVKQSTKGFFLYKTYVIL